MKRLVLLAVLCLAVAGAEARPKFLIGGGPGSGGGSAPTQTCGDGGVCAQYQAGQTFVTWDDVGTDGAGGASSRYRMYRSTAALNSGNCTGGTLIASYILNNSAQLHGGVPNGVGRDFSAAARVDAAEPMAILSDLGDPLPTFSGLQVYTALANENAYYCIVSTTTSDTSPSYIGAVGPIAETVADPQPIKYAASGSRGQSYGNITSPSGRPLMLLLHASDASGGAPPNSQYGDYWSAYMTTTSGNWQDGMATTFGVLQNSNNQDLELRARDTLWNPLGTFGMQTFHSVIGMTPNPLVGPANRMYLTTQNKLWWMIDWTVDHYGADPNQLHCTGQSMGAMGCATVAMRKENPRFSATWSEFPVWQMWKRGPNASPGHTWEASWPFKATLGTAPATMGSDAATFQLADGSLWGGDGGYSDILAYIEEDRARDLPVPFWGANRQDTSILSPATTQFQHQLAALATFQTERRGHGFAWNVGNHETTPSGLFNCAGSFVDATICIAKSKIRLDLAYPAFSNSSIDDDYGTGTLDEFGIQDGDPYGGVNIGFDWTITADTASELSFTVENKWMDRTPVVRETTLAAPLGASDTTIEVTDGTVFASSGTNPFLLIDGKEIVRAAIRTDNTFTSVTRGYDETTGREHEAGVTVRQMLTMPTAPNGGPFSTMTVDITPRRIQSFVKGTTNGQVITCDITPDGGSTTQQTPTVADGIFTLTGVVINASGGTVIACE